MTHTSRLAIVLQRRPREERRLSSGLDGYGWTASTNRALSVAEHEGGLDVVGQCVERLLTEHRLDEGKDALR